MRRNHNNNNGKLPFRFTAIYILQLVYIISMTLLIIVGVGTAILAFNSKANAVTVGYVLLLWLSVNGCIISIHMKLQNKFKFKDSEELRRALYYSTNGRISRRKLAKRKMVLRTLFYTKNIPYCNIAKKIFIKDFDNMHYAINTPIIKDNVRYIKYLNAIYCNKPGASTKALELSDKEFSKFKGKSEKVKTDKKWTYFMSTATSSFFVNLVAIDMSDFKELRILLLFVNFALLAWCQADIFKDRYFDLIEKKEKPIDYHILTSLS